MIKIRKEHRQVKIQTRKKKLKTHEERKQVKIQTRKKKLLIISTNFLRNN